MFDSSRSLPNKNKESPCDLVRRCLEAKRMTLVLSQFISKGFKENHSPTAFRSSCRAEWIVWMFLPAKNKAVSSVRFPSSIFSEYSLKHQAGLYWLNDQVWTMMGIEIKAYSYFLCCIDVYEAKWLNSECLNSSVNSKQRSFNGSVWCIWYGQQFPCIFRIAYTKTLLSSHGLYNVHEMSLTEGECELNYQKHSRQRGKKDLIFPLTGLGIKLRLVTKIWSQLWKF